MSANLLTLNYSKTEFLIIGLKQQLSEIDNSSLSTTHSARNLGFILDERLTFFDQISSLSKSCYSQINRPQQIQNYLARAVVKDPKFSHITPILRSLHCLKSQD